MEEYQEEYFHKGWKSISEWFRVFFVIVCAGTLMLISNKNTFYWQTLYAYPCFFVLISMVDFILWKNKKLAEVILYVNIITIGLVMVNEDMFQTTYLLNEHWISYILYLKYIGSFFFLKWTRIVLVLYFIMICYILMINYYYSNISLKLYAVFSFVGILFPITLYFGSQNIKEIIILLKTKKDLIHTIRSILQVFPEGVIIRSIDPVTKQTIIKFANDVASQFLKQMDESTEVSEELKVIPDNSVDNQNDQQLAEFLHEQELKIDTQQYAHSSQMIELKECKRKIEEMKELSCDAKVEEDGNGKSEFYNIKSIKVQWENCNSFMHVFVNTTQIKKLEQERATTEYQQSMFTSLSHDMRTPLNAITNSLQLSSLIVEEMKKKILKFNEANASCQSFFTRFERFIQIGQISSCLLLNLIEDILDMAKFRANMFKLIMSDFKLSSLLTEVDFLFGFQCVERNIQFRIVCDPDISSITFVSDPKRIKQVLINLISNSIKFTERGSIIVTVSRQEIENELYLEFAIKDTGVGISKNDIPKLFSKFGMLQKHLKFNASGSGIGLSISKMIVESLGGKISVESEEGKWSRFSFTIKCTVNKPDDINEENKEFQKRQEVIF